MRNILATFGRRTQKHPVASKPQQRAGRKTVFIIEDNPDSLRAISQALGSEAYHIEMADSAESALRKLSSFQPDLILLDPQVPAGDGTRLARRLLADEDLVAVPIIALTQSSHSLSGALPVNDRFDGHIQMPAEARVFSGQVKTFLEPPPQPVSNQSPRLDLSHAATSDRRREAAALLNLIEAGLPDSQFAPEVQNSLQLLADVVGGLQHGEVADYLRQAARLSNAATARARSRFRSVIRLCRELADRDPDVVPGLADLRAGYMNHRSSEMESLEHALKNGDFPTLQRAGHNLKGTGAAYGFSELSDIGRALEGAAKCKDNATVEAMLDQIESYVSIVLSTPVH
ncbi:MAG TPA: response regulator [Bryobacteraceae bacterium]|jgi:CheY-like chemotaxis protein|nr:response regulator [Bryobacteraceae bacterium]